MDVNTYLYHNHTMGLWSVALDNILLLVFTIILTNNQAMNNLKRIGHQVTSKL